MADKTFPTVTIDKSLPEPPKATAVAPAKKRAWERLADRGRDVGIKGMITPGNVDLAKQPQVENPFAGGGSTVWSASYGEKGEPQVLLPRVTPDGRILARINAPGQTGADDTLNEYKKTGRNLGTFDNTENASAYAKGLHEDYQNGKIKMETPPIPKMSATIDRSLPDIRTPKPPDTMIQREQLKLSNLSDMMKDRLNLSPAAKMFGEMITSDQPLLPPPPPPTNYSNDPDMSPTEVGVRTFFDESARRLYDKVLRPLSTPQNVAIGAGMVLLPPAAAPYAAVAMATPMAINGYKTAVAAQEEKDPTKRMEMYSDAALQIGMATLIGAKGGKELIEKAGEVPVVNAIKEHVQNSKLITDESGYITKDFLGVANRWLDNTAKTSNAIHRTVNTGHPQKVLEMARETSDVSLNGKPDINIQSKNPFTPNTLSALEDRAGTFDRVGSTSLRPGNKDSFYDPHTGAIRANPDLQTLGHEIGHKLTSVNVDAIKSIPPKQRSALVDQYLNDHFSGSQTMENIGKSIKEDLNNPTLAKESPGSPKISLAGKLRQEVLADAIAWKNSVETLGKDKALETFRPDSVISYTINAGKSGADAILNAVDDQWLRDRSRASQAKYGEPSEILPAPEKQYTLEEFIGGGNNSGALFEKASKPSQYSTLPGSASYNPHTKVWENTKGEPLPEHLQSIPKNFEYTHFDPNPNANTWAIGMHPTLNKKLYVFNPKFLEGNQGANFSNVAELNASLDGILTQVAKDFKGDNSRGSIRSGLQDNAAVVNLIVETGIRIGGKHIPNAKKQSYGGTTLEGRHVVQSPDGVRLQFVGKSGKDWDVLIKDKKTANDLIRRKNLVGPDGRLFNTSAKNVRQYTKSLGPKGFVPKNLRTQIGTNTAIEFMETMEPPKNPTQYKKAVAKVGDAVADRLTNTRSMALNNYINPTVWAEWKKSAGMEGWEGGKKPLVKPEQHSPFFSVQEGRRINPLQEKLPSDPASLVREGAGSKLSEAGIRQRTAIEDAIERNKAWRKK